MLKYGGIYMTNKKSILYFQIISIIFVSLLGTLLHFTFEWSNNNAFIGLFSPVNESTWEHLKLLFFPILVTIIVSYFFIGKSIPNFMCAKTIGIIVSLLFTIIFFYTSSGILGFNYAPLNIATFYIAAILGEYTAYKIMLSNFTCNTKQSVIILLILLICFIVFTYFPPQIGLFKDPLTGNYGIT